MDIIVGLAGWSLVVIGIVALVGMVITPMKGEVGGGSAVLFIVFVVGFGIGSVMVGLPVPWAKFVGKDS